jgi:hypothetical protein
VTCDELSNRTDELGPSDGATLASVTSPVDNDYLQSRPSDLELFHRRESRIGTANDAERWHLHRRQLFVGYELSATTANHGCQRRPIITRQQLLGPLMNRLL